VENSRDRADRDGRPGRFLAVVERTGVPQKTRVQNSPLQLNWLGLGLSYACVLLLLLFVVAPRLPRASDRRRLLSDRRRLLSDKSLGTCAREGGLVGLLTYGVYNFTNLATLSRYPLWLARLDTTWGGTLFTLVSVVMVWLA